MTAQQLQSLVEQARRHGVTDEAVLAALGSVPRDRFVGERCASRAFDDGPLPIAEGQTISQPAMVAIMVEAARLGPADRVLEVGTGSGYGAAVLASLAGHVVSIERHRSLAETAAKTLRELGIDNVEVVVGDGTLGWPPAAPFDAIVVTAAAPAAPPPLLEQLAPGGRLVTPVGSKSGEQRLMRWTRSNPPTANDPSQPEGACGTANPPSALASPDLDPIFVSERLTAVRFVPLIGTHGFPR